MRGRAPSFKDVVYAGSQRCLCVLQFIMPCLAKLRSESEKNFLSRCNNFSNILPICSSPTLFTGAKGKDSSYRPSLRGHISCTSTTVPGLQITLGVVLYSILPVRPFRGSTCVPRHYGTGYNKGEGAKKK